MGSTSGRGCCARRLALRQRLVRPGDRVEPPRGLRPRAHFPRRPGRSPVPSGTSATGFGRRTSGGIEESERRRAVLGMAGTRWRKRWSRGRVGQAVPRRRTGALAGAGALAASADRIARTGLCPRGAQGSGRGHSGGGVARRQAGRHGLDSARGLPCRGSLRPRSA